MNEVTIQQIMDEQQQDRDDVINNVSPQQAAFELAQMALEDDGSGAEAAARLLLDMEHGQAFNFRQLLSLDTRNRAKADLLMRHYMAYNIWPSAWIKDAGHNGNSIMLELAEKWGREE